MSKSKAFKEDKLNRENYAEFLMEMIKSPSKYKAIKDNSSLILAVDSTWGAGKTTFINMLRDKLVKECPEDYIVISYNAWKCDFSTNPLETLLCEIYKNIVYNPHIDTELKKDFNKSIELFVRVILTKVTGDKDSGESIIGTAKKGIRSVKNVTNPHMQEYFKGYKKEKERIEGFKRSLQRICEKKKIVIIIDELDRCRPNFSIELLEMVKHIFDVSNLTFVFALNMGSLSKGIEKVYGDINGLNYLGRFFDYINKLPKPNLQTYIEHLMNNEEEKTFKITDSENEVTFNQLLELFSSHFDLSLRDLEIIYKNFKIFENINLKNESCIEAYSLYLFFLIIKYKYSNAYWQIFSNSSLLNTNIEKIQQLVDSTSHVASSSSKTNKKKQLSNSPSYATNLYLDTTQLQIDSSQKKRLEDTDFMWSEHLDNTGKLVCRNDIITFMHSLDSSAILKDSIPIDITKNNNFSNYIFSSDIKKWEQICNKTALQYIQEQLEFFDFTTEQ